MNFEFDSNTDEDFFGSLRRAPTNLVEIFGGGNEQNQQQQSLKYVTENAIPADDCSKASGSDVCVEPPPKVWITLMAKVAFAYKNSDSVGKVGVALLHNMDNLHKIVIYKTKVLMLGTCTLDSESTKVHRREHYIQFFDDTSCCWSLYFDIESNGNEFWAKLRELNITTIEESTPAIACGNANNFIESAAKLQPKQTENHDSHDKNPQHVESQINARCKTGLITRMAKMGQQLPKLPASTYISLECTDSSGTEVIATPTSIQTKPPLLQRVTSKSVENQIVPVPKQTCITMPPINNIETQFIQMLITENRTQNAELRMNIGKLESKVEKALDKIDTISTNVTSGTNLEDEILALEEKVLELKKENRKLKQDWTGLEESRDSKNCEDIRQRYRQELAKFDLTNVSSMEQLVGDLLRKHAHAQEQLLEYKEMFAKKDIQSKYYSTQLNKEQQKNIEQAGNLRKLELHNKDLQEKLTDIEKEEVELKSKHAGQMANEVKRLEDKIKFLQEQLDMKEKEEKVLQHQLAESVKAQMHQKVEPTLKTVMNSLYSNLLRKLENSEPIQGKAVIAIIGKAIREETLNALEHLK